MVCVRVTHGGELPVRLVREGGVCALESLLVSIHCVERYSYTEVYFVDDAGARRRLERVVVRGFASAARQKFALNFRFVCVCVCYVCVGVRCLGTERLQAAFHRIGASAVAARCWRAHRLVDMPYARSGETAPWSGIICCVVFGRLVFVCFIDWMLILCSSCSLVGGGFVFFCIAVSLLCALWFVLCFAQAGALQGVHHFRFAVALPPDAPAVFAAPHEEIFYEITVDEARHGTQLRSWCDTFSLAAVCLAF